MRASQTSNGITLRIVAGTYNAILGIDLQHDKREGCLGFSIRRVDLGSVKGPAAAGPPPERWLPNMLTFPSDKTDPAKTPITTLTAPLQKFRWGDYTCTPGHRYRYQVVPRYGAAASLLKAKPPGADEGVTVEVVMEDPANEGTQVFFNRGAGASKAFEAKFGKLKTEAQVLADTPLANAARAWLSRGLEEALLAFLARAKDGSYQLHAAVYEFQKASFLAGIAAAKQRGVDVQVVYHHREKNAADPTAKKNDAAIKAAKLPAGVVFQRKANPQGAIMHNKFVVLLKKAGKAFKPVAVWTGSTNWTDGAIYGQLNVGHAINDPVIAQTYDAYWDLLKRDLDAEDMKHEVEKLTPVNQIIPPAPGINPIFSPQSTDTMLHLYSSVCVNARCVLVSAPFALSPIVLGSFTSKPDGPVLRFFLLDKEGSLGKGQEVKVIENDPSNAIGVAVVLKSPLHDYQGHLLEGKESFRHAGVHIHSKVIVANPFGNDPVVITGSANFSNNSTEVNDSNSLVIRGNTAVADIYTTEFMRLFEAYHFRASEAAALTKTARTHKAGGVDTTDGKLGLVENDSWSEKYFVTDSYEALDRMMFAGTLH